jgi:hypothetical protein
MTSVRPRNFLLFAFSALLGLLLLNAVAALACDVESVGRSQYEAQGCAHHDGQSPQGDDSGDGCDPCCFHACACGHFFVAAPSLTVLGPLEFTSLSVTAPESLHGLLMSERLDRPPRFTT